MSHSRWKLQRVGFNQLGKHWDSSGRRKVIVSPTSFHHVRPKVSHCINDNYCVSAPVSRLLTQRKETVKLVNLCRLHRTGQPKQQRDCKLVSVSPDWTSAWRDIKGLSDSNKCCKLSCCKSKSCTYCTRAATKERHKSGCC